MRQKRQAALRLLLVLTLLAASASCLGGSSGRRVLVIMTPWTAEAEKNSFQAVLTAFEARTGITVRASPTRALDQVLRTAVQQREEPDLAVMANPGALRSYAQQGYLVRLDRFQDKETGSRLVDLLKSDYGPPWSLAGEDVNGDPYAVMVKASVKSLVWYAPQRLSAQPPDSWADLVGVGQSIVQRGGTPWCLALADPPNSGWPGTDWIEDILLHRSGANTYTDWVNGKLKWNESEVEEAWRAWDQIVTAPGAIHGGPLTALLTGYGEGAYPLFTAPPGCYLTHGAPVAPDPAAPTEPVPGRDYDFVPFPEFRPTPTPAYEVSGDLVAMFRDSPEAEKFMAFLASQQAQEIWPGRQPESAFSADRAVTTRLASGYATGSVTRRIGELLTSSATLCFDASDSMPSAMAAAFNHAVVDYLNDPTRLRTILAELEKVRADVYPQPTQISVCGP
ncbi:ABC transporter substrate-binding protein [Kitasatospora purpeofusca]|uniref:ABC transporter substrate-binding protein n=1 Tax=Kitasatospora purpeofusca TaxID=67352 RepID=A0ABZ1TTZ8_9ACTN|nr:ABC transporter substrate-binding protein [Kitasatospora purpeofusca]